jgi:glutathione S-transferase
MIEVHHLNHSRSQRILWLLEELDLPYQIVPWERDKRTSLAPKGLRRIHALGKSPVVKDGEIVLAESGAIIDDLLERYDGKDLFSPTSPDDKRRYRYFLHYAEGSLMSPLLLKLVLTRMGPFGLPARPYVNGQLKLHLQFLEDELAQRPHFAGEAFSAADVQMWFPVEAAVGKSTSHPRLQAFCERMRARPAFQRALGRGGPFSLSPR